MYALTLALAQEQLPEPTTYKPASDEDAVRVERAWIQSNDPRLIAWGGYLASKEKRRELIQDLLGRIDFTGTPSPRAWVADALIRLDAPITAAQAMSVGQRSQRLVLVARAPGNTAALQQILASTTGDSVEWVAAADLLARHPPAGFAVEILHNLDPTLSIHVEDEKTTRGGRGGG